MFYFDPDDYVTCVQLSVLSSKSYILLSGYYSMSSGITFLDVNSSLTVSSCDPYIYRGDDAWLYISGSNYDSSPPVEKKGGALGALALLAIIPIALIMIFCCCLKRRKDSSGKQSWVCRKSTSRCACLCKRPRSQEESTQSQIIKMKNHEINETQIQLQNKQVSNLS